MKMTSEERELLKRMDAGELDGMVGDMFQTCLLYTSPSPRDS